MQTMTANQAKQNFGELLDKAQNGPVEITRHGRRVAVMLSAREYEQRQLYKQFEMTERATSQNGFAHEPTQEAVIADKIEKSRAQFARGEGIPADEVYARMRKKLKAWDAAGKK